MTFVLEIKFMYVRGVHMCLWLPMLSPYGSLLSIFLCNASSFYDNNTHDSLGYHLYAGNGYLRYERVGNS